MSHLPPDIARHSSSSYTTSPRPSPLSRPHWPWTTYSHRPSSSSSSVPSVTGSPAPVVAQPPQVWDAGSTTWQQGTPTRNRTGSASVNTSAPSVVTTAHEETTRHWNFSAFEWTVRGVHALRDLVEGQQGLAPDTPEDRSEVGEDVPELLRESPMLGEGKFKLEVARTPLPEDPLSGTLNENASRTLSMYITSLMLDDANPTYELGASIMAAIKCQDNRAGERGARPEWVWQEWEEWVFRNSSEFWECTLPSLSTLLQNQRIAETDSFVICVQIHCPIGPFFPQQPSAFYVPRDLLEGLEASLDNPSTGDVKFVCLERLVQPASPTGSATPHSRRSSSASSAFPTSQATARKRIIYAHSDILTRRSDYFATMLSSSFAETSALQPGERKVHTVIVEEADFVTVYWLLKWCYANWLLFKEEDDPREAVDGIGAGWSARWLTSRGGGEWDWKSFAKSSQIEDGSVCSRDDLEIPDKSVASVDSVGSSAHSGRPSAVGKGKSAIHPPSTAPAASTSRIPPSRSTSGTGRGGAPASTASPSTPRRIPSSKAPAVAPPHPTSPTPGHTGRTQSSFSYPISPRQGRHGSHPTASPDPHPHPTPTPPPASALSVYQIAHRYAMPGLSALALEHMMNTLNPTRAFPLLLATCFWDELHSMVEDYVVERWEVVSRTDEFEKCCQEVAAGEWGPEGGKTLTALFRRLTSPNTLRYPRT